MGMAVKAASSGLTLAFQTNGIDGLLNVLKEKFNGKPQVTINRCILLKIYNFFSQRNNDDATF